MCTFLLFFTSQRKGPYFSAEEYRNDKKGRAAIGTADSGIHRDCVPFSLFLIHPMWQKKARAFLHLCQIRHYKRDPISAEPTLFSIYDWIDDRIKAEIRRIMKRNENK